MGDAGGKMHIWGGEDEEDKEKRGTDDKEEEMK
eukprot:CAMPEP_0175043872 /NCGR_PEP_ID=MMETSP0052_2-20121109/3461_1 /TAXON_ID=51329 ORGANISM="Polytomella parva, Strain SAG 63-3" /NCGR_SAMPLE_ID=MMETSP0052_2 /ASSEMBLY_ACC=CAM_ASM_000194 /LENGTH=32 /DNA_ID= /DNA_START= /DNA_END= /DNA_ORIENTATION=